MLWILTDQMYLEFRSQYDHRFPTEGQVCRQLVWIAGHSQGFKKAKSESNDSGSVFGSERRYWLCMDKIAGPGIPAVVFAAQGIVSWWFLEYNHVST